MAERGVLLLISRSDQLAKRVGMMQEMHFRNLSQKVRKMTFAIKTFPNHGILLYFVGYAIEAN